MNTSSTTDSVSFHESTVVSIEKRPEATRILLDGVRLGSQPHRALVSLQDVRRILRDGLPVDDLQMECPDGELLSMETIEKEIRLVIEWNFFALKQTKTVVYRLLCAAVNVELF